MEKRRTTEIKTERNKFTRCIFGGTNQPYYKEIKLEEVSVIEEYRMY